MCNWNIDGIAGSAAMTTLQLPYLSLPLCSYLSRSHCLHCLVISVTNERIKNTLRRHRMTLAFPRAQKNENSRKKKEKLLLLLVMKNATTVCVCLSLAKKKPV